MMFTLADIDFADALPRWFDLVDQCGRCIDLMFSLSREGNTYSSSRFFNAAAAAEGLHQQLNGDVPNRESRERTARILKQIEDKSDRAWLRAQLAGSHRPLLAQRLHQLLDAASPTMNKYVGDRDKWVTQVKRFRNLIGHGANQAAGSLSAQVRLTATLELLYRIVLLRRLGFSSEQCDQLVHNNQNWSYLPQAIKNDVPELFL